MFGGATARAQGGGTREAVRDVWQVGPGDVLVWREVTGDGEWAGVTTRCEASLEG